MHLNHIIPQTIPTKFNTNIMFQRVSKNGTCFLYAIKK